MSMVAWGLAELFLALGEEELRSAALHGARFCASLVREDGWPEQCGIRNVEHDRPLTHTIGYAMQGLFETGILLSDEGLVKTALSMATGAAAAMRDDGFLPGRLGAGWECHADWTCLTGTAQIAYVWLRAAQTGRSREFLHHAMAGLKFIRRTQQCFRIPGIHFGVRGSYPFRLDGYCRATYPNWAQKFFVDALMVVHAIDPSLLEEKAA